MTYVSLNECIKGLNSTEPVVFQRDRVTGWRVIAPSSWFSFKQFLGFAPSAGEICAEVNMLDPEADGVIAKVSALFQEQFQVDQFFQDEREEYEKALCHLDTVSRLISSYEITNQSLLIDIALKAAAKSGEAVSKYLKNYGIKDEEARYKIALTAARQSACGFSAYIENYGIKDQDRLYQLALITAKESGEVISYDIQKYGIQDQERLFQIAMKAAAQSGKGVSLFIQNYGIEEEELRYQIASLAAENNGGAVSEYIKSYGIQDEERLYQIAFKAAANNGWAVTYHIKKYGIENDEWLGRIALQAVLQDPAQSTHFLHNYNPMSNIARLLAMSVGDPPTATFLQRSTFLSLIDLWRKKELPAFLLVENPDPFVLKKHRKWIVELLLRCEGITNEQLEQEEPLFTQLMQLRNPVLRSQITAFVPEVYKNRMPMVPIKVPKRDYSQLARLLHLGLEPNTLSYFYSKLEDPFDQEIYLHFLLKTRGTLLQQLLEQPSRKAMLHFMRTAIDIVSFGHPELLTGDLDQQLEQLFLTELEGLKVANFKQAYEKTLNKFRGKELIFTYFSSLEPKAKPHFKDIIEFILNGTFFDKRYDVPHLKMIFKRFPIEEEWRKGESISELLIGPIEEVQIPISLAEMRAKIITDKHLEIAEGSPLYRCLMGETRENCLIELQEEIRKEVKDDLKIQIKCLQLMDPNLTMENKAKFLGELVQLCQNTLFLNDVQGWQRLMGPVMTRSDYLVSDTDDPNHLFLLGEEVAGSCQKITAGSSANRGLLGYMLNGYNRAVVVTDKSGSIVARCLIRLYWDGEKPVLYQERFYTRSSDPKLKPLINAMCLRRAKALNIPLVNGNEEGKRYPKTLQITGGRADIEYVDAIGGVQPSKHIVPKSYVIWAP